MTATKNERSLRSVCSESRYMYTNNLKDLCPCYIMKTLVITHTASIFCTYNIVLSRTVQPVLESRTRYRWLVILANGGKLLGAITGQTSREPFNEFPRHCLVYLDDRTITLTKSRYTLSQLIRRYNNLNPMQPESLLIFFKILSILTSNTGPDRTLRTCIAS